MKATLEYDLPEESHEHSYALAGVDALILISDLENEIRNKLNYGGGFFKEFKKEQYCEQSREYKEVPCVGDDHTLSRVWDWIIEQKQERRLPELV